MLSINIIYTYLIYQFNNYRLLMASDVEAEVINNKEKITYLYYNRES